MAFYYERTRKRDDFLLAIERLRSAWSKAVTGLSPFQSGVDASLDFLQYIRVNFCLSAINGCSLEKE
jgi:hypothetical protein